MGEGGRRGGWVGVAALGLLLGACRGAEATAPARAPVIEELSAAPVEGAGAAGRWGRALVLGSQQGLRAAVAPDGDVLVAATYGKPVDLGAGPLPFRGGAPGPHLLLARYGPRGQLRWARGFAPEGEGAAALRVGGLAVDAAGDIFLGADGGTGLRLGGLAVGPGAFVARLSGDGRARWVRPLAREGRVSVAALAVGAQGEVVAAGDFSGGCVLADGTRVPAREAHGAFVLRLSSGGEVTWGRSFAPAAGLARARAVALEADGSVYVAGDYAGVVSFGDSTFVAVGESTPFVLKLDAGGRHAWSRELAGARGSALALALGEGRLFVTGSYEGRYFFEGQWHASDWQDAFLLAYGAGGEEQWSRSLAASGTALSWDGAGGVLLAGVSDEGSEGSEGSRAGVPSLFVARFLAEDGTSLRARAFGGSGALYASALASAPGGGTVLAGSIGRGPGPGPGARDGFLLHLQP